MNDTGAGGCLPVALAPLSVGRPEPPGLIEAATAGQFCGVGMTLRTPEGKWQEWCRDPAAVADVKAALFEQRLSALDVGIVTLDPATDLAEVRELAGLAASLGASRLVLMCRDPDFDRSVRQLRLVGDIAANHGAANHGAANHGAANHGAAERGLRVGVEFMPYTPARDLRYAIRLVEAAGHANVGVLFDMFQHIRSGGEPSDLTPAVTSTFVLVQLCDGALAPPPPGMLRQEALTDRRYPGEGEFPLAEIMSRIPHDVPVTVEAPCQRYASLPLAEQGAALGRATRLTLSRLGRG